MVTAIVVVVEFRMSDPTVALLGQLCAAPGRKPELVAQTTLKNSWITLCNGGKS